MRTSRFEQARRQIGGVLIEGFFEGAARAARALPIARPSRHGVLVERNLAYRDTGRKEHTLDLYRPVTASGPLPVVLYLHGGGFRILSKDTHWVFGLSYARRGFLVVNVNYQLAPRHPFPAAVTDVCAAYLWLVDNAARLGADLSRLVVAGESAGANLATVLTMAATHRRPEPFAADVFATGVVPRAIVAACGMFEVSRPERFVNVGRFQQDRIEEVSHAYLGRGSGPEGALRDLADPLVALERGSAPERPMPPFFLPVGTWDPLREDTHRLHAALHGVGSTSSEMREYEKGVHAFHAFVFTELAQRCWRDTFDFLDRALVDEP